MRMRWYFFAGLVSLLPCSICWGQGGIVQQQHDDYIRAQERSAYAAAAHNNADDYPKATEASHKTDMSPNYVPVLSRPAKHQEAYVETPVMRHMISLHQKTADGDEAAGLELGQCYYEGRDVAKSRQEAYRIWKYSAGARGRYLAGKMVFEGDGVETDKFQAYPLMHYAALHGDAEAKTWMTAHPEPERHLGEFPGMLTFAEDVFWESSAQVQPVTAESAVRLLDAAAKAYNNEAKLQKLKPRADEMVRAGKALTYGLGLPMDLKGAYTLLMTADYLHAEGASDAKAWVMLALEQKYDREHEHYKPLAGSQARTGSYLAYLKALVTVQDAQQTFRRELLKIAATTDNPQALTDLAIMEWEGNGGDPDDATGLSHLQTAAKTNRNAQYILGLASLNGLHGVPVDRVKAFELLQLAAEHGQADARHMLAVAY